MLCGFVQENGYNNDSNRQIFEGECTAQLTLYATRFDYAYQESHRTRRIGCTQQPTGTFVRLSESLPLPLSGLCCFPLFFGWVESIPQDRTRLHQVPTRLHSKAFPDDIFGMPDVGPRYSPFMVPRGLWQSLYK